MGNTASLGRIFAGEKLHCISWIKGLILPYYMIYSLVHKHFHHGCLAL